MPCRYCSSMRVLDRGDLLAAGAEQDPGSGCVRAAARMTRCAGTVYALARPGGLRLRDAGGVSSLA